MTTGFITCDTLDERLPEYLESELPPAARAEVDGHIATCARCSTLVRDLGEIGAAAARLPVLQPSRDLWEGIASRIEAPVVPIPTGRSARRVRPEWWRFAAVAAGLVIATAGITYTATARYFQAETVRAIAASTGVPARIDSTNAPTVAGEADTTAPETRPPAVVDTAPSRLDVEATRPRASSVTAVAQPGRRPAQRVLDAEIVRLQSIVSQRRAELDPKTVAIIEHSLRVIDDAIAQSRAALASDPASRFLNHQLNNALDRKVELLRTVALLPARS